MLKVTQEPLRAEIERAVQEVTSFGLTGVVGFAVAHGNGNVIAIIDLAGRADDPPDVLRAATTAVSKVVESVRVDGVLFFYPDHERGLRMIFFDCDGTWEAMCGNGLRCVTRYAADRGLIDGSGVIVTDDGPKPVRVDGTGADVVLGPAREVRQVREDWWFAYTGVPHLVVFVDRDELDSVDVAVEGARLRHDLDLNTALGHPDGVHVDFVAVDGAGIAVRTYEVGVEDETACCGTGVAAAGYLAWRSGRVGMPTIARTRGGDVRVGLRDGQLSIAGEVGYLVAPVVRAGAGGIGGTS
ncbi:diaminopimelate epimerase [Lentzea sp. NPDC059081]|uniref:diaminopimelate epimerase n=1 Tax=Lentzea sp. NPDC059081 TaxID=3346719 RepID=UPI0036B44E4C